MATACSSIKFRNPRRKSAIPNSLIRQSIHPLHIRPPRPADKSPTTDEGGQRGLVKTWEPNILNNSHSFQNTTNPPELGAHNWIKKGVGGASLYKRDLRRGGGGLSRLLARVNPSSFFLRAFFFSQAFHLGPFFFVLAKAAATVSHATKKFWRGVEVGLAKDELLTRDCGGWEGGWRRRERLRERFSLIWG